MIPSVFPENSTRVYDGIRFQIYQWDQERYDGTHTPFESIYMVDGAFVITVTHDQKIIILYQEQPRKKLFLGLPGGAREGDEPLLDTAKRELLEETGYTSNDWSLFLENHGTANVHTQVSYYIAKNAVKIDDPRLDGGEKIDPYFYTFDEFLMLSEDERFVNFPLIKKLFMARIYPYMYDELYKKLFE